MSKYWSDMFLYRSDRSNISTATHIISKETPIGPDNPNIMTQIGINPSEYEEVSSFLNKYNRLSGGNTTLLPPSELSRYLSFDNISILLRSKKGDLIGTILSLKIPIRIKSNGIEETITHLAASFLCVHPSLRGMGICMSLIRSGIIEAHKEQIYSGYCMVSFEMGKNSINLRSWYRPINLIRARDMGFVFWGSEMENSRKIRLRYNTKLLPNIRYDRVDQNNSVIGLEYYRIKIANKKFAFYPDTFMWEKWIEAFPTYMIYKGDTPVGIVSTNTAYCIIEATGVKGKILFPNICLGNMELVLNCIHHIADVTDHDLVYFNEYGDIKENLLESNKYTQVEKSDVWFSLYNNSVEIEPTDIFCPLL